MLNRLKEALVKSFVGAIGLGWLFAQGLLQFAYALTTPISEWVSLRQYRTLANCSAAPPSFSFANLLPGLARSVALLLLGYLLLRWLYFKPPEREATE
jgi:hypothetical protein